MRVKETPLLVDVGVFLLPPPNYGQNLDFERRVMIGLFY